MGVEVDQWHYPEDVERLYGEVDREKEQIRGDIQWRGQVGVAGVN